MQKQRLLHACFRLYLPSRSRIPRMPDKSLKKSYLKPGGFVSKWNFRARVNKFITTKQGN